MPVRRHRGVARRSFVESLEGRRLLAIAPFEAKVAFAPKDSPTPGGYVADNGKMFGQQANGLRYGWEKSNVGYTLDRHTDAKQRYDGLAYLGNGDSATRWEIEVPDGLYEVQVMSGDAKYTNGRYHVMAEERTVVNSKPNKARPWRSGTTLVYVSDGRLTLTAGGRAANNKINSVNVRQVDPHVTGQDIVNPFSNAGIVQNEVATDVAIPAMKTLGMKTVRLWYDVKSWSDGPDRKFLKLFKEHHQAGFAVTAVIDTPSVPTADEARAFFERLAADSMAVQSIDYWELGNEPNKPAFWGGNATQFVEQFMKPAYEVLNAIGEPTIGGGATWDVGYAKNLADAGYADYCDYVGFHPYGESAEIVLERAAGAKAVFGGKPMVISEWNVQGIKDRAAWSEQVRLAAIGLAELSYMSFYFALANTDIHAKGGGLIEENGEINALFYDVARTWGTV